MGDLILISCVSVGHSFYGLRCNGNWPCGCYLCQDQVFGCYAVVGSTHSVAREWDL